MGYRAKELTHVIPKWWERSKSVYCPVTCSGAGAALMQFGNPVLMFEGMKKRISSFLELPKFLDEARALGSNIVYLVEYWDGGYLNMGDFTP